MTIPQEDRARTTTPGPQPDNQPPEATVSVGHNTCQNQNRPS
jgi:hypothetical protein